MYKIFAIYTLLAIVLTGCADEGDVIKDYHGPLTYANIIQKDQYECNIEDNGDWTLLVTLERNNFNLDSFRVPKSEIDTINQAYADQMDFLFIIYRPAVIVDPRFNRGSDRAGGGGQTRYYLENPGLLQATSFTSHFQAFHFVDPDATWFQHYDQWRDKSESGLTIAFDTTPFLEPEEYINPRKFKNTPLFGTSLHGWWVGGAGAPDIREEYVLNIYIR